MEKFAFLIHPLDIKDVIRFEPKASQKREALVEKVLDWMPPFKVSTITGMKTQNGKTLEGYFIVIPLMPHQFLNLERSIVYKKIIHGGKIAESLGAKILGLGGFTSVVGDAGINISQNLNIAVTSGNSYTIATAIEATLLAAKMLNINLKYTNAAIIGASGSIGSVCAQILAKEIPHLTLIARNLPRLKKIAQMIQERYGGKIEISTDLSLGIRNADIIISASSSGGIIKSSDLKIGSVICDVALPHDVCREVAMLREDVLVIEGGLVKLPGNINLNYDFGYPKGLALACMAETMILTLEGKYENFSLGREIKIEKVEEITELAKKHGFKLAGFRSFDQIVSNEKIEKIKNFIRKKEGKFLIHPV
ncbi:MAG: shikimate dehydrogenase [Armatimonadetes bacterium]|nr:shikimate dehydrogenase [Armatimonadota bacterium]